jgi:hypothetical protein
LAIGVASVYRALAEAKQRAADRKMAEKQSITETIDAAGSVRV